LLDLGDAKVLICGMGRIGGGAFEHLQTLYDDKEIIGIDYDIRKSNLYKNSNYTVYQGDTSNPDLWSRLKHNNDTLKIVLLCMPNHEANLDTTKAIRDWGQNSLSFYKSHRDKSGLNSL